MINHFLAFQVVLAFGLMALGVAIGLKTEDYQVAGIFAGGGFFYLLVWIAVKRKMNSD
jgi:hypothetical protein